MKKTEMNKEDCVDNGRTIPGYQPKLLVQKIDKNGKLVYPKPHPFHLQHALPANPMKPLNWNLIVKEALRRRKIEGLTQKSHAALAKVCIPTMHSFDEGDLKLSLKTVFKILKVVGLVI